MRKKDALDHYGSTGAIASALGITLQAVSQWDEIVPEGSAYKLQALSGGKLKVNPALYAKGSARAQMLSRHSAA